MKDILKDCFSWAVIFLWKSIKEIGGLCIFVYVMMLLQAVTAGAVFGFWAARHYGHTLTPEQLWTVFDNILASLADGCSR